MEGAVFAQFDSMITLLAATALINGFPTYALIDSGMVLTLSQEKYFHSISTPTERATQCELIGIGTDPVRVQLIHNVPLTFGSQTLFHTVCVAPM